MWCYHLQQVIVRVNMPQTLWDFWTCVARVHHLGKQRGVYEVVRLTISQYVATIFLGFLLGLWCISNFCNSLTLKVLQFTSERLARTWLAAAHKGAGLQVRTLRPNKRGPRGTIGQVPTVVHPSCMKIWHCLCNVWRCNMYKVWGLAWLSMVFHSCCSLQNCIGLGLMYWYYW